MKEQAIFKWRFMMYESNPAHAYDKVHCLKNVNKPELQFVYSARRLMCRKLLKLNKTVSKLLSNFNFTMDKKTTMFPDPKVDGCGIIFATVKPV